MICIIFKLAYDGKKADISEIHCLEMFVLD